jgi:hypothetical protein
LGARRSSHSSVASLNTASSSPRRNSTEGSQCVRDSTGGSSTGGGGSSDGGGGSARNSNGASGMGGVGVGGGVGSNSGVDGIAEDGSVLGRESGVSIVVGLYKFNPVHPSMACESAWFQLASQNKV